MSEKKEKRERRRSRCRNVDLKQKTSKNLIWSLDLSLQLSLCLEKQVPSRLSYTELLKIISAFILTEPSKATVEPFI